MCHVRVIRVAGLTIAVGMALFGQPTVGRGRVTGNAATAPRLLATGQTVGYRGNTGLAIDGNADDGDLILGRLIEIEHSAVVTPTTQAQNLVVDRNSGLMWLRDLSLLNAADGRGAHGNVRLDQPMTWQEALEAARRLEYGGHDDWRLPNLNELETLVDFGRSAPAMDPPAFPETFAILPSPYLWSSTTNPATPTEAYYLNVFDGHVYPWSKGTTFAVRPVRDVAVDDPVALLRTGQTTAYRVDGGAAGSGDDGDLQRGLMPDYAWSDDGTIDLPGENVVVDRNTGLMWLRDPQRVDGHGGLGGNQDLSAPVDWQTAIEGCNDLEYAGYADWRLPNLRELWSITQPGRAGASIDDAAFPNAPVSPDPGVPWVWWSSTTSAFDRPDAPAGDRAWYVTTGVPVFRHHVGPEYRPPKARPGYVRCVRDAVPRIRHALYFDEVRSSGDFRTVTLATGRPDIEREGKFILPVNAATAPFMAAYQDVNQQPLHLEFLRSAFPEAFAGLTPDEYTALVARRATRGYFAGGIRSFSGSSGGRVYGFDVYTEAGREAELLSAEETAGLYRQLARTFRRRPLVYSPTTPEAAAKARSWVNPGLPIDYPAIPPPAEFEAYTTGIAYGTVRLLTLTELAEVERGGGLSWQDILVLDQAPTDLEGIVAAILTGERQGELSHLNVRAARRGTPNAYVNGSLDHLRPHAGQLVRLAVTRDGYLVTTGVSLDEAAAWWRTHRPPAVAIPVAETTYDRLDTLAQIAAGDAGASATLRVGGKAANLARLYTFLPAEHQLPGFAIPFHAYEAFVHANALTDRRIDPPVQRTYADYLAALQADPRFAIDPVYRAELLTELRGHMEDEGQVPRELVRALAARIEEVFGPGVMVRFRSSSNAEDGVLFNGAGLYDSRSVCAADSLDGDTVGPSRCDPNQPKERTIERGLRGVWASLWNYRAWEERTYYGIDQDAVRMAILVTPAFPDERANGVAFTGNPTAPGASEFLINVQLGDTSVVLPDPGVVPERDLLTVADGRIVGIRRVQASSLVSPGTHVLSDAELRELGAVLLLAQARFPVDLQGADPRDVLLDLEFKFRKGDDGLVIKQIRPFLAVDRGGSGPQAELRLDVPSSVKLCSLWRMAFPIRQEYDEQRVLEIPAGEVVIPLGQPASEHGLFGALASGPAHVPTIPVAAGQARVTADPARPGFGFVDLTRRYRAGDSELEVRLSLPDVRLGELNVRRLDEDSLTAGSALVTLAPVGDDTRTQILGPCGLKVLEVHRYEFALANGGQVIFDLRKGRGFFSYQWAQLEGAMVVLPDGRTTVRDYGHLVYDAVRHNWSERFWVLFDPPLGDFHGLEIEQDGTNPGDGTYRAHMLDANLQPQELVEVRSARISDWPASGVPRVVLPATAK